MVNHNRDTESSAEETKKDEQTKTFNRKTDTFANNALSGFDDGWDVCDPLTAPLLTDLQRINRKQFQLGTEAAGTHNPECSPMPGNLNESVSGPEQKNNIADRVTPLEHLLTQVNRAVMPFHHLIAASLLAPPAGLNETECTVNQPPPPHPEDRQQKVWQALAVRGVPANEAMLLDDALSCRYFEIDNNRRFTEVNWEVRHRDPLEGCAELYLAEMFLCKRPIYEAGDELRAALALDGDEVKRYLSESVFAPLVGERIDNLLLDGLTATSILTVSTHKESRDAAETINAGSNKQKSTSQLKTGIAFSKYFNRHGSGIARRIESWLSADDEDTEDIGKTIYRLRLGDYWLDWQRAARAAKFDFDYLRRVPDARAVRFYELTKLLRGAVDWSARDGKPPLRLEIEYERFAALMPLPLLAGKQEIKRQIADLIKPLKTGSYVKSFNTEPDWRGIDRQTILVFRFAE